MKKTRLIELIFGKTGTGKSTLAKELMKRYDRIIIIDSHYEYNEGIIFYSFKELTSYIDKISIDKIIDNDFYFTFICRFDNDYDIEKLFEITYAIGNLCIVLEEAELYISPYQKKGNFLKLIRHGRHRDISLIGIARRTVELHSDIKAMCNIIYSFKQTHPNDLKKMQELGLNGLENLGEHEYIYIEC